MSDSVDFALAVYREEGVWTAQDLAHDVLTDVDTLTAALRRFPGDGGALGMIAIDEDFFILVRVAGSNVRALISDASAAEEFELAESVIDFLGLDLDEIDDEDPQPAGDMAILADSGVSAFDMGILLDDEDAYPDELLSEIAKKLGFGALFEERTNLVG